LDPDSYNNLYNEKSGGYYFTYQVNPIVLCKLLLKSVQIVVALADNQKDGIVRPLLVEERLLLLFFLCGVFRFALGTTEKI